MNKRLLSLLMLCCMVVSLLPAAALAAPEEEPAPVQVTAPVSKTVAVKDESIAENDDLFYQYLLQQAREDKGSVSLFSTGENTAGSKLTGQNKKLYDLLATEIKKVADGSRSSTLFSITAEDLDAGGTPRTADDLGVTKIEDTGDVLDALLEYEYTFDAEVVLHALSADFPQYLYWYDKTEGCTTLTGISYTCTETTITLSQSSTLEFLFAVSEDYDNGTTMPVEFWDGTEYFTQNILCAVDTALINKAKSAISNANAIVEKHKYKKDYEKLEAYKDEICSLVIYNSAAASSSSMPYGDPWQLVYVFDEYGTDPLTRNTNVVCEGYAKAFQFLCDLSAFSSPLVQCYSVTGTMTGGEGAGRHMWNIVTMPDGVNYLVDVTNVDEGTIGSPDELFLKGVTMTGTTTDPKGFYKTIGGSTISYIFDDGKPGTQDMVARWGAPLLTLSGADYGECRVTYDTVVETASVSPASDTFYFNNKGGSLPGKASVSWGGNQFDGWFTEADSDKGEAVTVEKIENGDYNGGNPTKELTVYAHWSCPLSFTYPSDVAVIADPDDLFDFENRYQPRGTVVTLPTVSRTGFSFTGWFDSENTKAGDSENKYTVTDETSLTAKWNCDLTLDANGGAFGTDRTLTVSVPVGTKWSDVPSAADPAWDGSSPSRMGCDFAGWYTAEGNKVEDDPEFTINTATTLYAHWTCTLTLDANSGTLNAGALTTITESNVPVGTKLSEVKNLPSATWDGSDPAMDDHSFAGWWTAATGGTQVNADTYEVTSDTTLYAHWTYLGKTGTMTAGDDSLTWYYWNGALSVTGNTETSISATTPVLVVSYMNGQMLSVQFITSDSESAAAATGADTVKLFWVNTTGFTPLCACGIPLEPDPAPGT